MRLALLSLLIAAPLRAEPLCDGRYDPAAEILNTAFAKYDTLYSGGGHWHARDNLGATLDVWRLLQGQADLNLRRAETIRYGFSDDPLEGAGTLHVLFALHLPALLADEATVLTDEQLYITATTADLITTPGPSPGWWLDPDSGPLTDVAAQTRSLTQTEPLVAWLQSTLALSDAPWAYGWHLSPYLPATDRRWLSALNADARTRDGLPWQVVQAMTTQDDPGLLASMDEAMAEAVLDCTATPAHYAAHALIRLESLRNRVPPRPEDARQLPAELRRIAAEQLTRRTLTLPRRDGNWPPFPEHLTALMPEHLRPWVNVARTYRAETLSELIDIHTNVPLHPYSYRALNALSVQDIIAFAQASGRSEAEHALLIKAAFTRAYALGQDDTAAGLLPTLRRLHPDRAGDIDAITSTLWPRDVQLAMVLFTLPDMTGWITPPEGGTVRTDDIALTLRHRSARGMDLPADYRNGQFLQRDLETFLVLPNRWQAFFGMRGASLGWIDRAHDRRITPAQTLRPPQIISTTPGADLLPFHSLIAWEELAALSPRNGAARRASETIVRWADARTDTTLEWVFAPQNEMATALRQIVLLARHNAIGDLDGKPIARRAFEIMHYRLYDSPATWETTRWHPCSARCER